MFFERLIAQVGIQSVKLKPTQVTKLQSIQ